MAPVIAVGTVVAFVVAWHFFLYKQSGGRTFSWLWSAFGTTAASVLYLVAGALGYTLDRHDRFVSHTAWAGHVIWSEIALGVVFALLAVLFWRKGLERIRRESPRSLRHA
jgi:hypothetical protein